MSLAQQDPRLLQENGTIQGYARLFLRRVRGGEIGALPVIVGLVIIWTIFQSRNENFLSAVNLTNLTLQVAAVGLISLGAFMVLLIGQTDLSVGSVSGVTAATMGVLMVQHEWNPVLAVLAALVMGALIGGVHGFFFTKFGVPAFVVTLAGLIGWQGVQLWVLGKTGSLNIPDSFVTDLTSTFFDPAVGWTIAVALIVLQFGLDVLSNRRRSKAGLRPKPLVEIIAKTVVIGAALAVAVAVFNNDRGLPLAIVIFLGFSILFDLLTRRTRFGRHIYAVGGSTEAARRAGISIHGIHMAVFMIAGMMAATGGVMASSRLLAVNQSSGGSDTLLNAIAAAVIGGTSLFGGRGSAFAPLLGMLVIGSISNGMDLLGEPSSTKFMITGAVLLTAVTIDAIARRGRQSSGR
jgi:D-xylose transport system permease protein